MVMEKGTIIAIVILALVIGACVVSSIVRSVGARRSGEGKKQKDETLGTLTVGIEGMHCDHCRVAVQERLNKINGVSAKVSLSLHSATVKYSRPIEDSEIREAIESIGYGVGDIKHPEG